ncbi:hypothetical protein JVT61DRAFT_8635 [Boletus reticuloceps]|uniref:Uncharacterized protein n=1 Tax=Boletus reticuloceps TaxID=495285 RepID=A0A8I2Z1C0_9AGAM|nr:hypothetical protein JVT61DRAFT_8635 [Boletus reticuloceps]
MFTGTQPERIRRILFFLYAIVTVNTIVFSAIWYGPHSGLSGTHFEYTQLLCSDFVMPSVKPVVINVEGGTACQAQYAHSQIPSAYDGIPRGLFDILLLGLAIYRFTKHCIETRRMMGRQKVNKYMMLLLEHSVLYFVLYARFFLRDRHAERSHPPIGTSLTKPSKWVNTSRRLR